MSEEETWRAIGMLETIIQAAKYSLVDLSVATDISVPNVLTIKLDVVAGPAVTPGDNN